MCVRQRHDIMIIAYELVLCGTMVTKLKVPWQLKTAGITLHTEVIL